MTNKPEALPVIRIVAPEGNYDYQHKYFTNDTRYLVPAGLPPGEEAAIQALVCGPTRCWVAVAGRVPT
jgi:D-alanine-D-alanine ligase-like ATP-grasp enzyme